MSDEGRDALRPRAAVPIVRARLLVASLLLWVVFLSWEVTVRTWNLYERLPPVDLGGHFLAGMAMAALSYRFLLQRVVSRPHRWAFLATLLLSLAWEGVELVQEHVWPDPPHLRDVFVWDGVTDILASLVGAVLVFPLLRWMRRRFPFFQPMDV